MSGTTKSVLDGSGNSFSHRFQNPTGSEFTPAAYLEDAAGGEILGRTTDSAVLADANGSLAAWLRGLVKWAATRMPAALGQTTKSASLPVVPPSDWALPDTSGGDMVAMRRALAPAGAFSNPSAVTVLSTITTIYTAAANVSIKVRNISADKTAYIGGSGATTTNGYPLEPDEDSGWLYLPVGVVLYGICAATESAEVRILVRTA